MYSKIDGKHMSASGDDSASDCRVLEAVVWSVFRGPLYTAITICTRVSWFVWP